MAFYVLEFLKFYISKHSKTMAIYFLDFVKNRGSEGPDTRISKNSKKNKRHVFVSFFRNLEF